jgi:exonuclease SbcC
MLIRRVELDHIKSYEHAVVDFQEGVNAIVGHNGAGKSTLLEAIGFALFDSIPYSAKDFLREGSRTGTVSVTFEGSLDERPYRIERRIGGSHLYVAYDVELQAKLCEGKADVLSFVRRQIGADSTVDVSRLFADAIGVPQGTLTAAFLQPASQRKTIFDALLQVDEYRNAYEKLREPRAVLTERQGGLAQELAVLRARLERLPELQASVAQRTGELNGIAQALAALAARLERVQTRKTELDELRSRIDACERETSRALERCRSLEAQAAEAQRLLSAAESARAAVEANQEGHDRYLAAEQQRAVLDQKLRTRQALQGERAAADKLLALAQSELVRSDEQLARIAAAEKTLREVAPAVLRQGELEAALAAAEAETARLQALARNLDAERKNLAALKARGEQLAAELGQVEERQAAVQVLEEQQASLRQEIVKHTGDLATFQSQAGEIKEQSDALAAVGSEAALCPVCEQPLSEEHRRRVLARNEQRLGELRGAYSSAKAQINAAEKSLQTVTAEHKSLLDLLRSLPRPSELEETRRRIDAAAQSVDEAASAQAALDVALRGKRQLAADLQDLADPRRQSALAAQVAAERPSVEERKQELAAQGEGARQRLEAADAALRELADLDAELAAVSAALQANQRAYAAVLANRAAAEELPQRRGALATAEDAHQNAQVLAQEQEAALAKLRGGLDPVEYDGILSEDQSLRGEMAGHGARQSLLQQEQAKAQAELETLQRHQAGVAELEAQQATLSRQAAALETVRTLLRQSGPYITQALIRQVSAGANQIFGELMQDFSRELSWSEDYAITLEVDGASRQFMQLSGGEQMSAALALRLALVREISNIDIAFFDEPTVNLDDVRRESLARQIMNIRGFRQLFVISHDDTFEQVTQNLVRVRRHGSTSIVATVES